MFRALFVYHEVLMHNHCINYWQDVLHASSEELWMVPGGIPAHGKEDSFLSSPHGSDPLEVVGTVEADEIMSRFNIRYEPY